MKIKIQDDGMITGFPHHDGRVLSMNFVNNSTFEITISSICKDVTTLVISSVKLLSIENVREANIVDGFYVSKVSKLSSVRCGGAVKKFGFRSFEEFMSEYYEEYIFEMACSFGAELFAIIDNLSGIELKNNLGQPSN